MNQTENLRILSVTFDTSIEPWEIAKFRGAIARKVGLEHEWFHNHNNESGGYHHRYPLIQYKLDAHQRRQRPMLLCLGQGVDEAYRFFSQPDWSLTIGDKAHDMRIARLHADAYPLRLTREPQRYRIHKWKAFNAENYQHFRSLQGLADQFKFLETVMAGHLIAFAEGVDWRLPERFEVKITDAIKQEWVDAKGVKVLAFTLDFTCNLTLPDYVGLGKGAGVGYGVVRRQTLSQNN